MANLKDLRNRITSVQSTQKITKAMQMVAASKLRRAQEAAEAARPYAERMESVLASLASSMVGQVGGPKLLAGTGRDHVHLVVVATSERGLCGGFNTNIVKGARLKIAELIAEGKDVKIVTIGKKGAASIRRNYSSRMVKHFDMSHVKRLSYGDAAPITDYLLSAYDNGEFDVCTLFYAKFQSALTQIVTAQQMIPASYNADNVVDLGGAARDLTMGKKWTCWPSSNRRMIWLIAMLFKRAASNEDGPRGNTPCRITFVSGKRSLRIRSISSTPAATSCGSCMI